MSVYSKVESSLLRQRLSRGPSWVSPLQICATDSMAPPQLPQRLSQTAWPRPPTCIQRVDSQTCCRFAIHCPPRALYPVTDPVHICKLLFPASRSAKGSRQPNQQPLASLADDLACKQEALQSTRNYKECSRLSLI